MLSVQISPDDPTQSTHSAMASSTLSILSLPPELLLEIADYLSPDAILSLKFSHRILDYSLPSAHRLRDRTLSRCARLAILSYLAKPNSTVTHQRCTLCKAVYPLKSFQSSSSPACAPLSFASDVQQTEVVELPQRLCAWHVGRLARIVHTEPAGRNEWVASSEEMCMHCGAIQSWTKCDCTCDSCSVMSVTAYTRYLNNKAECRKFLFYRKPASESDSPQRCSDVTELFVRETCFEAGMYLSIEHGFSLVPTRTDIMVDPADPNPVIHLPVRHLEDTAPRINDDMQTCTVASRPTSVKSNIFLPARRKHE